MTEEIKTFEPDDPQNPNNLVVLGPDGDPLPDRRGTKMLESESYERVIEGLRISADSCMHMAKHEPRDCETWKAIGALLDKVRLEAARLAALALPMMQQETRPEVRGEPIGWREARRRFLEGLRQATGGMRQLAVCFRGDIQWTLMASELERRQEVFEQMLRPAHPVFGRSLRRPTQPKLILPDHFTRQ